MSYHSFKQTFTASSHGRFRTPSPPRDAIEPLSPLIPHTRPVDHETTILDGHGGNHHTVQNGWRANHTLGGDETESEDDARGMHTNAAEHSYESAAHAHTQPIASPIDELASVALATSPTFSPTRQHHRSSRSHFHSAPSYWAHSEPHHQHFASANPSYNVEDRPTKRARSEVLAPPQQFQSYPRPATSYNPSGGWALNVEETAPSEYQADIYQRSRGSHDNDYQDAELLLYFKSGAADQVAAGNGLHGQSVAWVNGWSTTQTRPLTNAARGVSEPHRQDQTGGNWKGQGYQVQQHSQLLEAHSWDVEREVLSTHDDPHAVTVVQTHTPPDDNSHPAPDRDGAYPFEPPKKPYKGWPKGKPRGSRTKSGSVKRTTKSAKAKQSSSTSASTDAPEQLQSPQSLLADVSEAMSPKEKPQDEPAAEPVLEKRRNSLLELPSERAQRRPSCGSSFRSLSVPREVAMIIRKIPSVPNLQSGGSSTTKESTVCAVCHFSPNTLSGEESRTWMQCDGCKSWFHFACAGFKERVVRTVDKFFCRDCKPKHGPTTCECGRCALYTYN